MKASGVRHKKAFLILIVLLLLYVFIPVFSRGALPFHLFRLNAEEITAIEIDHWSDRVVITDPEEITVLVDKLNHVCFRWWYIPLPAGGTDYILRIYQGDNEEMYGMSHLGSMNDGAVRYIADLTFITSDIIPY